MREFPKIAPGEEVTPAMVGYRMRCCDCGLVHVMDFRVIEIASGDPDGDFLAVVPDNVGSLRVVFSATREDVEKEELKNIIDQLDFLLAMQGRLLFAKDSYDAEEAADFGAMLLAYFQSNGSTIRAALCAAEESKP